MADNNLEKELAKLYSELRELDSIDEETACSIYNVDFKHEAEFLFREEIASHEKVLREIEECEHREVNHCRRPTNLIYVGNKKPYDGLNGIW